MAQQMHTSHSSAPTPVAELLIELTALAVDESGSKRRVTADATLSYAAAGDAPRVASERYRFIAPADPIAAGELAWYLERYGHWPGSAFQERVERIEQQLRVWGRMLWEALVTAPARPVWEAWQTAEEGLPRRFTVRVSRELAAPGIEEAERAAAEAMTVLVSLPWELIRDESGYVFQRGPGVGVRRCLASHAESAPHAAAAAAGEKKPFGERGPSLAREPAPGQRSGSREMGERPPIRVLLVSPRPDDRQTAYVDHRLSAGPLVEVLSQLGSLAKLTLLTPPTFEKLREELRRAADAQTPYHVVHIDGHGVLDCRQEGGAPQPGLCFEDPADSDRPEGRRTVIVSADALAALVAEHRVPLVFLEACRHTADGKRLTGAIAKRLLAGGVAAVAAVSQPVLVATVRRFVAVFYRELLAGRRISEAMLAGRCELGGDTCRGKVFTGELHLWDWFVPVLFQGELDRQLIIAVPPERIRAVMQQQPRPRLGDLPATPAHTFVGRSRELLKAERLLEHHPYIVFQAAGGEGKNSLAAEFARWLVASQHFQRAAFVSLQVHGSARAVHHAIGKQLVPRYQVAASLDPELAVRLIERVLNDQPTLLVFANMEAVLPPPETGTPASAAYEPKVLEQLLKLISHLGKIGRTRLIFTSREPLPGPFGQHHVPIGPLDRHDAIALVAQVMAASGYQPPPADPGESAEELTGLVEAVSCHPRSLVLAADELVEAGVRATTENLRELMATLHQRHPEDERTSTLRVSVELSLRRLSAATRWMIRPLGVFHGGGHLTAISTVLELDIENDEEVVLADQLIAVSLAKMLTQNYMSFHPALAPALLEELSEDERDTARAAWAEAMTQLIGYLDQQQIKNPALASTLTLVDLPNLLAVLDYLEQEADAERVIDVASAVERLVEVLGRPRVLARVEKIRLTATQRLDEWGHARFLAELAAVEQLLESGRYAESAEAAKALLRRVEASEEHLGDGAAYDHALAYLTLGRALAAGEQAEPALAPLSEARKRFRELAAHGGDSNARMFATSSTLAGDCLMALGHSDATAEAYETAIAVAGKRGDRDQVARVKIKLGRLHLEMNRISEALAAFTEAREYFEGSGEQPTVAAIWHHIASVHERTEQYADAEKAYLAALKIEVRTDQRSAAAATLAELGNLHDDAGRLGDAVDSYRQAAELFSELHDLAKESIARSNVADKLMKLYRWDEARDEILRAIECDKPFGHAAEPWKSFSLLANLERAVGNAEAAGEARQRALDAYLDYRRSGGENQTGHREIFTEVGQAVAAGQIDKTAAQLAGMLRRPDLPASLKVLIPALQAVLHGSRDPDLAADPNLYYRDAAELRLLVETLPESQNEPQGI